MVTFPTFALLYLSTGMLSQQLLDVRNESASQVNAMPSQPVTDGTTMKPAKCETAVLPTASPSLSMSTDNTNIAQSGAENCVTTVTQANASTTASVPTISGNILSLSSASQNETETPLAESTNVTTQHVANSTGNDTKIYTVPDCLNEKSLQHQTTAPSILINLTTTAPQAIADSVSATSNLQDSPTIISNMTFGSSPPRNLTETNSPPQNTNTSITPAIPCSSSVPHSPQQAKVMIEGNEMSTTLVSLSKTNTTPLVISNLTGISSLPQSADSTQASSVPENLSKTPSPPLTSNSILSSPISLNSTIAFLPNTINTTTMPNIHDCSAAKSNNIAMPTTPGRTTVISPPPQAINDIKASSSSNYTTEVSSSPQAFMSRLAPRDNHSESDSPQNVTNINRAVTQKVMPTTASSINKIDSVPNSPEQTIIVTTLTSPVYFTEASSSMQSLNTATPSTREHYSRSLSSGQSINTTRDPPIPNCLHETPSLASSVPTTPIPFLPEISPKSRSLEQATVTTIVASMSNASTETILPTPTSSIGTMSPIQENSSEIPYTQSNMTAVRLLSNSIEIASPPKTANHTTSPIITDSLTSSSLQPAGNTLNIPCQENSPTSSTLEFKSVDTATGVGSTESPMITPKSMPTNVPNTFETLTPIQQAAAAAAKSFSYARHFRPSRIVSAIKYHIPPPKLYVPSLHSTLLGLHQPRR